MHPINVTTTEENKLVVQRLTKKLSITEENIIARIAINYSISRNKYLELSNLQSSKNGKSYKEFTLLGKFKMYYVALMCQHYKIEKSNPDLPRYFKLHLDDGLQMIDKIFADNPNYPMFDFLLKHLETGIEALEKTEISLEAAPNRNQNVKKEHFNGILQLEVGKKIGSGEKIIAEINDTSKYNNCHIAVAGESGSGKTQFALELLKQFYLKSDKQVKFLYLDFKGLKKGDEDSPFYRPFFEQTDTKYVNITEDGVSFPLNPLSFIDTINKKDKLLGINKFVDIIAQYGNIGENKEQTLKQSVIDIFETKTNGEYPDFKEIFEKVEEAEDGKKSRLTGILDQMQSLEIFESKVNPLESFINHNYYFSLSGDLPKAIQFTATFLIINYIYNIFMNMKKAPFDTENKTVALRYVLLIDEAHVIFKDKKSQEILEKMLREIRSQGVSVILLSQGIEEFNQPSFDFSTMCNTSFLLKIKDINNLKVINKFLGYSEKEGRKAKQSLEKIETVQAGVISNIQEFTKAELFELSQFSK
jgi:DNA sulfur modification protein DndE